MKKALIMLLVAIAAFSLMANGSTETSTAITEADFANFPDKDITIVYNSRAGSSGDMLARAMAQALEGKLNGHQIIVQNIKDSTGYTAWQPVSTAKGDGYTLACLSPTAVAAFLAGNSQLDYHDFTYLSGYYIDPQVVYCRKDSPYTDLAQLIDYIHANPGKVKFGLSSITNDDSLLTNKIAKEYNCDITMVTYGGGSEVLTGVLGSFVDIGISDYADVQPNIESGDLIMLGTFSETRYSSLPDVPTAKELGIDIVLARTRGFAAPKDTDPAIAAKLNELFRTGWESESFQSYMKSIAVEPKWMTGEEYLATYDNYGKTVGDILDDILSAK